MTIDLTIGDVGELSQMRRRVGEFFRSAGAQVSDVVLAVNELVTNSLLYGGGRCRLLGTYPNDHVVRIEVTDGGGEAFELPAEFSGPTATSGRGLMIVRSVTSRCGMSFTAGSTTVWFEVDLPVGD